MLYKVFGRYFRVMIMGLLLFFTFILLPDITWADIILTGDTSRPTISTFASGESVTLTFHATGLTATDAGLKLLLDYDDENDKVLQHQEAAVTPDASGNWSGIVAAPANRLGFYRVYVKLSNGVTMAPLGSRKGSYLTYCIVPDPVKRQDYPEQLTRFGMQGGFSNNLNALLPYLGIRWVLGGFFWKQMEPDHAGQYAQALDKELDADKKANKAFGLPSAVQGNLPTGAPWKVFTYPSLYNLPSWASINAESKIVNGIMKPEAYPAWTEYAGNVARGFSARYPNMSQRLYQITWEPNYPWGFTGTPDQLVQIYALCYKAIHDADPKAMVTGPTYSSLGGDSDTQLKADLQKGLGRYLDVFSIHPYFPSPPEQNDMVDLYRNQADILNEYVGHDIPRVGSEEGFATGEDKGKELEQARTLTRQNLITLGEGYWFNIAFYIADYPGEPGYGYYYNLNPKISFGTDKVSPKPIAPVYAAQSFLLDGSRSLGPIEWLGPTALGYIFERDGQITLALWDWGIKPRKVTLPVGVPTVTVYDWMGNPSSASSKNGMLDLTLGPDPVYVVGAAPELWGEKPTQKPLTIQNPRLISYPGDDAHLTAAITPGVKSLQGTLTLAAKDNRLELKRMVKQVKADANGAASISFDIHIPPTVPLGGYTLVIALHEGKQVISGESLRLNVESPVTITSVTPSEDNNHPGLAVVMQNATDKDVKGKISIQLMGVPESQQEVSCILPAHGAGTYTLPANDPDMTSSRVYQVQVGIKTAEGFEISKLFPVQFTAASIHASSAPPSLQFSGVLGQSQPVGTKPIATIGMMGVAPDVLGTLWSMSGQELLSFTSANDRYVVSQQVPLPAFPKLGLQGDGAHFYYLGQNNKLYSIDPSQVGSVPQALCTVDPNARAFAVAPNDATQGYAANAKIFILTGNNVTAYKADGSNAGVILNLPPPPKAAWYYCAIGVDPESGDLLVGSYYPDSKVYRYGADGKMTADEDWPRPGIAQQIVNINGTAWATLSGGGAQAIPDRWMPHNPSVESKWTQYPSGLAIGQSGNYWVASSQGLCRFNKNGISMNQRIGGLNGVRTLALPADGTIIAGVDNGQWQIRLSLGDEPDACFTSNANEPWRVGGGWTDKACAVVPDGGAFLALDETAKAFWRFDPEQINSGQKSWAKVAAPANLVSPRAMAIGQNIVWVLDKGTLLEGNRADLTTMHPAALPGMNALSGVISITATNDNMILLADASTVKAFSRGADGVYKLLWQNASFKTVAGIAVTPIGVVVSDSGTSTVTLLTTTSGTKINQLGAGDIAGGWKPGAIAASGSWAIVADNQGDRLVRLRLRR
jgi:hypothetical protein